MGKMSRFLRICAVLSAMFFSTNVFAAGYTCDNVKQYTSCSAGYYLTGTGVGNSCAKCPDGWISVANGTTVGAAASCFKKVTLNKNGFSFALEEGAGTGCKVATGALRVYYNTACTLPTISGATQTYYTAATGWAKSNALGAPVITTINATTNASDIPTTIHARKTTCAAGAYKSGAALCSDCPANYNSSLAGTGDINSCFTSCAAGTRKSSTTDTSCTTPTGGWATAVHKVYYGNVSPIFMPPYPFTSNGSTTAAQHNSAVSMNASSTYRGAYLGANPAGHRALQNMPAYGVRVRNSSDNGEYSDMLLNDLTVIPAGTALVNITSGTFNTNTIISDSIPSDMYGITDTANLGKINDSSLTTGTRMPAQSWVEYRFDPINLSFVQVTLGYNDDITEIDIQLDISGDGQWVSITGDGAPEYTFDTTNGTYRTLIIPAVAWLPCDAGQYRTSNQNAPWSSLTTLASCNTLPAGYWNNGGGINATGSVISGKSGGLIAAGRYGEAGATSSTGSGAVSAGYYSTGGGTSATPTANGDGCVGTNTTCGTIAAGYYGAAGATSSTGSGAVSAGYYSTGGGTSATPTANGDGCVGDGNTCGQLSAEYYSNGGSTTNGATCISGKTCGMCNASYRANTATGKTAATQCQISCGPGTAVLLENFPCAVVTANRYKTGTALVNYGSKSPTAADVTSGWSADTIYSCPSGYNISGTTSATHDARTDCSISCEPGTQVASADQTCTTPTENNWYTDAQHSVSAGSTSATNVKNCNTGYSTAATAEATAHDEVADCKIICPQGYYIPTAGAGCVVCPAGKYCEMGSGVSQTATKDPTGDILAGYYSTGGASVAKPTNSKGCISGQTCGICAKGKYSLAGASACSDVNAGCYADTTGSTTACPKSCSALGGGLYKNSSAGSDAETDCNFATTAGYYLAAATDTTLTPCAETQYCTSRTLSYPNTNSGTNCPDAATFMTTSYPDDWYNPTSVTVSLILKTGREKATDCTVTYSVTNPRGTITVPNIPWNINVNEYRVNALIAQDKYWSSVNPGFYVLGKKYSICSTNWSVAKSLMKAYDDAQPCPAGSYCPGYASMPECTTDAEYTEELGKLSCSDNTNANYPDSIAGSGNTAGATNVNMCYLTTTSGKFVKTANAAMETCTCGGYCPGSVTVNYGGTGGKTDCTAGTYNNGTGSSASSACKTTSAGYYAGAASCSQTQVNANCWGGAGSKVACPNSCTSPYSTSAKGSDDANDCYLTTTTKNYVKTAGAGQTTCAAGTYCTGGSVIYKGGTVSGRSTTGGSTPCPAGSFCAAGVSAGTKCVTGSYSAAGASSCTACQDGKTTSDTGQTSCNADCSNKTGAYAWTTASWNTNNTMSNLCIISTCASKYYKNDNACSLCSGLASGFYPNSDNGNSSGTNACRTANLSGSYIASENASSATPCENWKYKGSHTVNYGSTSSCTDCAAAPSALSGVSWIKASGTGWDSYSDCVVTQTPANCTSGTTSRTQTNATTWGDVTLVSTLKSKDGYFASATATACSAAGDGYYAKAGATEQTACATGSYSTKSSASSTCTACPKGRTTSGTGTKYNATANTACSVTCSNAKGVYSWSTPSWSANSVANLCTVSACNADTYYTEKTATGYKNTCTTCGANSGNEANHTMSKCICDLGHTIDGKLGSSNTSISGCTRISGIACGVGQYLPAQATTCEDCDAGYYCPAKETSYSFQDYIQGRNQCEAGTYQSKKAQTTCDEAAAGYYVPLPAQTSQTKCTGATYQPDTGQDKCLRCPTAENLPSGITVKSYGYWISGGIPTERSGCSAYFNSIDLDDGTMGASYCYIDEDANSYGMTGTSKNGCYVRRENLTCDGGYYNKTFAESSTATQMNSGKTLATAKEKACTDVESGYWSAADELTRTACATGLVTCGAGKCANEAADCGRILHAGAEQIYLRSVARTKPALNVKIGNQTFFGALSTSYSSKLKVKNDGTTYSVVNDYQ